MAIHSIHPDSQIHGLADGCPRCDEHAEEPLQGLDNESIGALVHRLATGRLARSENERKAMANLARAIQSSVAVYGPSGSSSGRVGE